MDAFSPDANAFRFYENDGSPSESASTPIAAQDVNITGRNVDSDSPLHLRYRVEEVGAGSVDGAATDDYQLQFRKGGGGFSDVTTTSSDVQVHTTSALTDVDPTTNRSTDGISDGAGSFVVGEQEEGDGEITDHQLTGDNFTEHVWAVNLISADLLDSDVLQFRLALNGGNPGMDNSAVPQITVIKAAAGGGEPGYTAVVLRRRRTVGDLIGR